MSEGNRGWAEWSKHVLKELERLNINSESLSTRIDSIKTDLHLELSDLKTEITKVKSMQYSLDEVKQWKKLYENYSVLKSVKELDDWKSEIDAVLSPKQLSEYIVKINSLEKFKTQAVTIFIIIQVLLSGLFTLAIALVK